MVFRLSTPSLSDIIRLLAISPSSVAWRNHRDGRTLARGFLEDVVSLPLLRSPSVYLNGRGPLASLSTFGASSEILAVVLQTLVMLEMLA